MKKGDVVMVYQDPITKRKEEGMAKLLDCLEVGRVADWWEVKFRSNGFVTGRFIRRAVNG